MTEKSTGKHIRILLAAALLSVLVLVPSAATYAEDQTEPVIIHTSGDTEYCIKASELSEAERSGAKKRSGRSDSGPISRLLIVYNEEFDCSGLGGLTKAVFGDNGLCTMQFDNADNAAEAYDELQSWDQIESVEFDAKVSTGLEGTDTGESGLQDSGHLSWGVECIGADTYADHVNSIDHGQLIIAVVDSGVDSSHQFIDSRLTSGYDFVRKDDDPDDEDGHGTHVSGTVVDCTLGMNEISVMPVKVLDENGEGYNSDIGDGILYAADNGATVINLSFGGSHSPYVHTIVESVIDNGKIVVAASGNEGRDIDGSGACPAHIEQAITVGSVNEKMKVEYYSNYGQKLDVVAPGGDIKSTVPGGGYSTSSGTSMAAPHVSACAALLKLKYPDLNCDQISSVLKRSCISKDDMIHFGSGIINMNNLLADIYDQKATLKATSYEYSGKAKKPGVTVSRNGQHLFIKSDYAVTYRNNTNVGTATIVISGKGSYYGTKSISFKIVPQGTTIRSVKGEKKGFTVRWAGQPVQTDGYKIQYATTKTFKNARTLTVRGCRKTGYKVTRLKAGQKYYVRIRTYKKVSGKMYYSAWSKVRAVRAAY